MNIAPRPSALSGAVVTEAVRLVEEAGPLDDAAALREAAVTRTTLPSRIAHRADLLGRRIGLDHELARMRQWAPWVGVGLVLLIVLTGLALAGSVVGGNDRRINIMAALLSLLGAHLLTLAAWVLGLLLPLRAPRASFGWLWMTLTARVAGGRRGQAPVLMRAFTRLLQQARLLPWALGLASHGIWALSFVVVLGAMLFALAFHRYTLSWETTILDPQFFLQAVQALGRIPAWFGFATPDASAVLTPQPNDIAGQRAWAWWLTGCIAVYGLLPRVLLLMLSAAMWRLRKRDLQPLLDAPSYRQLALRFEALTPAAIVDADPGATRLPAPPRATDTTDAFVVAAYELPPEHPWPPTGFPDTAVVLRVDGSAADRRTLLDTAARLRPRALLLACRAAASPDRGTERLLRELLAHCGDCRLWLVPEIDSPAPSNDLAAARWRRWLVDGGLARITAHDTLAGALAEAPADTRAGG
ncbi:DUF2868 domain-containing protein [Variovorax sp. LT2P21]|uniref:DUF2868 domain-containing protein n=1 Tax=Variovorax sp. LT2P21 TaxID=3443731 RepID=UPI003F44CE9D